MLRGLHYDFLIICIRIVWGLYYDLAMTSLRFSNAFSMIVIWFYYDLSTIVLGFSYEAGTTSFMRVSFRIILKS